MIDYPRGCRYIRIRDGEVSNQIKVKTSTSLRSIMGYGQSGQHLLIQPRGQMRWYLFERRLNAGVLLIETSTEPDSLIMKVLLLS